MLAIRFSICTPSVPKCKARQTENSKILELRNLSIKTSSTMKKQESRCIILWGYPKSQKFRKLRGMRRQKKKSKVRIVQETKILRESKDRHHRKYRRSRQNITASFKPTLSVENIFLQIFRTVVCILKGEKHLDEATFLNISSYLKKFYQYSSKAISTPTKHKIKSRIFSLFPNFNNSHPAAAFKFVGEPKC